MLENILIAIGVILGICLLALAVYQFFKLEKSKRIEIVSEWLLLAVVQAEKELGSGTGQIKLRFVYDMFLSKFKFLAMIISFEQFSALVDVALIKMNNLLADNNNLKNYVEKTPVPTTTN